MAAIKNQAAYQARRTVRRMAYRGGYKYQLAEKFIADFVFPFKGSVSNRWFELRPVGDAGRCLLICKKGYAWDGCSGPTFDTGSAMRACLVHDAIYQMGREGEFADLPEWRKHADKVLRVVAVQSGMWRWRAWVWYRAVRAFGGKHNAQPRPVIYCPEVDNG